MDTMEGSLTGSLYRPAPDSTNAAQSFTAVRVGVSFAFTGVFAIVSSKSIALRPRANAGMRCGFRYNSSWA